MKKHFSSFNVFFNSVCVSTISLAMLLSLLAGLASCKNELLEPPDFSDRGAYSSTDISAPEVVVATQGGFRSITVSWSPVANAVKYEVYTSQISTVAFEKRTETNGNDKISVVIREDADVLAYYKVKAYDKNGNASEFSKTCHGTTLGMPVITNIIQDEFGKSATVRWWCGAHFDANTYKNNVEYAVILYADPEGTTQIAEQKMQGSSIKKNEDVSEGDGSAECTFTGLSPKTTYYYQVKAYLKDAPDKVEVSAIVDRETARRLIPNPVESLEATQGVSDKKVTLSFILPDFVDVKESSDVFLKKPLYFEISRAEVEYTASDEIDEETGRPIYKEEKKPLTDYTVIATIKSAASSEWGAAGSGGNTYYFDCTTAGDNTSSKKLTLEKTDGVQSNEGDAEPYIPGYKVTFTDTSAQRGDDKPPVYSYKITSYADISKKVTSDESVAKTIGWLIGNLKIDLSAKKTEYEYANEAQTEISKITVKFSCTMEDYGKEYTYIVTRSAVDADENLIVEEEIVNKLDADELKNFSVVYDLSKDKEGYYSYKFYIAPKGVENPGDAYYCYDKYRTKTPVTKDKPLEIKQLEVEDGYSDKFVIKWSYNKDYTYRLYWTPVVDGSEQEQESMALAESNENNDENVGIIKSIDSNGMATFEHAANSNDVRKYSMNITSGFGLPKELESYSYTLGTAVAKQVGYAYDSITIEWNEVQKADSYAIKARYDDSEDFVINIDNITETSHAFTPDDYNNAENAGKKMQVCITAKNAKGSTVAEEIPARLLGPALVNASVNSYENATEDSISLSWDAVEGAKGYLIRRVMYSDVAMKNVANGSGVTYYYEVASGMIKADGDSEAIGERATIAASDASFKLTDKYMEITTNDNTLKEYQEKQAKIAWGLPFRYVVLPVLESGDFGFNDLELDGNGKVAYANFAEKQTGGTATFGYGLKVHAKKSESVKTQNVTWEEPFYGKDLTPKVYRRKFVNNDKDEWEAVDSTIKNCGIDYSPSGEDRYCAWEYVVKYRKDPSDEIAPSYVEWLKNSDHDETRYDYGNATKEKLNKGYLLAMEYKAYYGGGEHPLKTDADYYSEDVEITSWDYSDRTLGPDKVELKVLSLDLASGWQTVGTFDSEIKSFTESVLSDTTVGANLKDKVIKLKPTGISNNKNGKGTTNGPLKILRSAKHYYGLNLYRGGNEEFDCKNYEEYAYRQITDEELIKSTMLVLVSLFSETSMSEDTYTTWIVDGANNTKTTYAGYDGSTVFRWGQGSNSKLYWQLSELHWGWLALPCGEVIYKQTPNYYSTTGKVKHFITVADRDALTSTKLRGYKKAKALNVLGTSDSFSANKNYIPIYVEFETEMKKMTRVDAATVYFTADVKNGEFYGYVNENSGNPFSANSVEDQRKWIPVTGSGDLTNSKNTFYCQDSTYDWWPK